LQQAVGHQIGSYFGHAADPELRASAASGGTVSAILIHLLETDQIDGALVVASWIEKDRVHCSFRIARTRGEVLAAQGSKYMPVYFRRDAMPLIRDFTGRLAVVLLPCDAQALERECSASPDLRDRIVLIIALACGHNSERELTDAIVARFKPRNTRLTSFQHRFGHWRGNLRIKVEHGCEIVKPFEEFSVYQNLFFFSQKKCHACFDHFGYHCDISAGDIWSQKMRNDPIKKNAVIVRTPRAATLLECMAEQGLLKLDRVAIEEICNGQSRALPFHYNVSARSRVGRVFGMRLRDTTKQTARWNEIVAAFLIMTNERITRRAFGRRLVLWTPRPLLKAYLMFIKALETL
jgi:coenzyme F420-reducing hydrogenase beta subunit